MSFYPAKGGNGNAYTAESFYLEVNGTKTIKLVANANAIYIMSDLKDATSFFKTYVNDALKTSSISNIFHSGDAWGASVGKLSGNFKKGDVEKFTPLPGIAHSVKMIMIAITEGE